MKTTLSRTIVLTIALVSQFGIMEARAAECGVIEPAANSIAINGRPAAKTRKRVGLVAHDALKGELVAWAEKNASLLAEQDLFSTGTTGRLVAEALETALPGRKIRLTRFNSGPLGGDAQMAALISQNGLDILIFLVDPMTAHPHEADVRTLLRLCGVYNTVLATTPATADYIVASPHFTGEYNAAKPNHAKYVNRPLP